jgi:hypothetical protein
MMSQTAAAAAAAAAAAVFHKESRQTCRAVVLQCARPIGWVGCLAQKSGKYYYFG